jgi:hypothetical protein
MPSGEEIAWFAGLFEGEGSLSRARPNGGCWRMTLRMTDEDVVRRVHGLFGGQVYDDRRDRKNYKHKRAWQWQLGSQAEIDALLDLIYPHMGVRRRAKMDEFREYFAKPIPTHSERSKRNWENPELRARMCAERKARWANPEWRAKQIVAMKRGERARFARATV